MRELKLEELTTRQKLGMAMIGHIWYWDDFDGDANLEYTLELIRNHSLGAVWIQPGEKNRERVIAAIREAADYPILIMADSESGIKPYNIGLHNALGRTDSQECAYAFGKALGVTARQMGYNMICNPVLDMNKDIHSNRSLGGDKYKVTRLALAMARGMHDGGIMTVGKHYPGATNDNGLDSHMAEDISMVTREELIDYYLYPYLQLMKEGLLDGIMTAHRLFPNIDPDYPTSLSQKVIGIIREQGFEGVALTDALSMMGVVAKFGARTCKGLAIAGGNDLALTWGPVKDDYEAICEVYDQGLIPDERLDEAVGRVLATQHKSLEEPVYTELTREDRENCARINRDSVYAQADPGMDITLSQEGKHYFVVVAGQEVQVWENGKVNVDTWEKGWFRSREIMERLERDFPNSKVVIINEFPSSGQNMRVLEDSVDYDDVVFITFSEFRAYQGPECFTSRIIALVKSLQVTNRISTIVHFGNPMVLEALEHIPRVLIGCPSAISVNQTLDVLEGKYPARGVLTNEVKLK